MAKVRDDGALLLSKLSKEGVPKVAKDAVLARCAGAGLEVGLRIVRVPLVQQLAARLAHGATIPLRGIGSAIAGGTKKEATDAAWSLVHSGRARMVLRGTEVSVVEAATCVLDERQLAALAATIADFARMLKAARKASASLLASDVRERIAALEHRPRPLSTDVVVEEARRLAQSSGLAFVPSLVRALGGHSARDAVHDALRMAARMGRVELRPESGMGRLSDEDLAFCVPGPQGSVLSWARTTEAP